MQVPLLNVDEIPDEGSVIVDFFGREVHVYQVDGVPKAVANVCLHFGGPLACQDGKFVCPWHSAEFSMADGRRLKGPAPANSRLLFLSTDIVDNVLTYVWRE